MIPPALIGRIRLLIAALVALVAALAVTLVRPVDPGALVGPAAPRQPSGIPFTDVHPWGANVFLEREVEVAKREQTAADAAAGGLRWARQHLRWDEVEPVRGDHDWSKYDQIVDLLRAHGLEVILRVDWTPRWAGTEAWSPGENNLPADVADYARFVGEAVRHFKGRVRFFQIWNEPNLSSEWDWRPVDPAAYTALLVAAAREARRADPDVVIVSAPLAINLETLDVAGNLSDLAYLDGMYEAGAAEHFDILGANGFGMDRSPDDPPAEDRLNLRRVELQRAVMERHGDDETAVWLSEYAWNAAPEWLPERPWQRVDEPVQAENTVRGVARARDEGRWPWAGVFNVWYLRREGGVAPDRAEHYFQMLTVDFVPRPVYHAVQAHARSLAVAGPGHWEERSAPVALDDLDRWRWRRRDGARDGNALEAVGSAGDEPDPALAIRFRGRAIRTRLAADGDVALSIAVDGRDHPTLARSPAGWDTVVLAGELPPGEHVLRLAVASGGPVALDAFEVDGGGPSDDSRWRLPLALAGAVLVVAALLARDVRRAARRVRW